MKRRRHPPKGPVQGGAIYFGHSEHNHAKKLTQLIGENPDFFLRDGRTRVMHLNHTHAPELWRRVGPGDIEVRVTHQDHCASVRDRRYFCNCDPEILFLEKDESPS